VPLDSDWALYEVTDALLAHSATEGFSVMLLGTDVESNRLATDNLRKAWPGAKILDGHHGFFRQDEESEVIARINEQNPDVLMIGMSSPKKEEFVWRNREKLKAKIVVPMGGVIDIYVGKTSPIPLIIKKLCLTWLYRFVQEPRRTRHIFFNGLNVLFRLIPAMAWAQWIKKDETFSIPAFYGVPAEK
jgi:N-acetylglucosaminyldiphosphoundecaprenol N-acetyl-beta-D-mannosaminyltransferase